MPSFVHASQRRPSSGVRRSRRTTSVSAQMTATTVPGRRHWRRAHARSAEEGACRSTRARTSRRPSLAVVAGHAHSPRTLAATRNRAAAALVMFCGRTAGAAAGAADRRGVLRQVGWRSVAGGRSACIWTERAIGNSVLPVTAPAGEQISVYDAAGGAAAMLALAHAWHQRCLADPEAQHPFSHPRRTAACRRRRSSTPWSSSSA
jgi:hypothetical protein